MIMLKTNLYMSVQIMDNIKYFDDFLLMAIINKLMGLRYSVPQINGLFIAMKSSFKYQWPLKY